MKSYKNDDFLDKILNAIKKQKLVLFVGAGISKLCGLPLWYDLAVQLLDYCTKEEAYNFTSKDKELLLSSVKDARELITIVSNIMRKKNIGDFYIKIKEALTLKKDCLNQTELKNYKLLPEIIKLLGNTIITTNADTIIDEKFDGKSAVLYSVSDINKFNITEEKQIFHIHGSINKPEEMVFSTVDYLKRYNSRNFANKMINVFNDPDPDRVILIIGYSLSELQLLDFIIKDDLLKSDERLKKTFLLNGYYSYQENVFEAEEEYYSTYGITLLSYCKDEKGYQGLVDALNDIKKIAIESSKKEIIGVNKIINLFNFKPTKISFDSFLNYFDEFDIEKQNFILTKLASSPYLYEWLNKMLKSKTFFNKYFDLKNNLALVKNNKIFPGCFFLASIKCENTKNKGFLTKYFENIIIEYLEHKSYFKNEFLTRIICKALMTNKEYILISKTYEFIEVFNEQRYREYWILFLCHENDILSKIDKKSFIKYSILLLKSFWEKGDKEYYFELFFNEFSKRIRETELEDIINFCKKIIDDELFPSDKHIFTRGTFEEIINGDNDYYPIYKIYKVFLYCINNLPNDKFIEFYKLFAKDKRIFYKQLSIYLVSLRYELLENYLFKKLYFYKNDRKLFAEIYSCFLRNKNKISSNKVIPLIRFINAINFDNYTEIWNLTAKKYLIELLYDIQIFQEKDDFKVLNASVNLNIDKKYKNAIKTMPSPLNMSKSIWSGVSTWKNDDKLKKELDNLNNHDFLEKIKSLNLSDFHIQENVIDSLKMHISNGFIAYLEDEKILPKLEMNLIHLLIDALSVVKDDNVKFNIINIIKIVNSVSDRKNKISLKESTFSTLSFLAHKLRDNNLKQVLFDYAFDDVFLSANVWKINDSVGKKDINSLFGVRPFDWLNLLITSCNTEQWKILKPKILQFMSDIKKGVIAKASLSANVHILWYLDRKFVADNLKSIFNNFLNCINYSNISFEFSQFFHPDFISELYKQNLLLDLLNDENFDLNWNYCHLITMLFLDGKLNKEIFECIVKSASFGESLFSTVSNLKKLNYKLNPELYDLFFKTIGSLNFDHADHSAVELFKLAYLFNESKYYSSALISLFSGKNSGYFASDLRIELDKSKLNSKEIESILVVYLENLSDSYYYEDEIVALINSIEWSSEKTKTEIINKLGKTNPKFLVLF